MNTNDNARSDEATPFHRGDELAHAPLTDEEQAEVDVAPEFEQLKGILPQATPTDDPAPAP